MSKSLKAIKGITTLMWPLFSATSLSPWCLMSTSFGILYLAVKDASLRGGVN